MSLNCFGDFFAIIGGELMINKFGLDWSIFMVTTAVLFFLVALLFQLTMPEAPVESIDTNKTLVENLK